MCVCVCVYVCARIVRHWHQTATILVQAFKTYILPEWPVALGIYTKIAAPTLMHMQASKRTHLK